MNNLIPRPSSSHSFPRWGLLLLVLVMVVAQQPVSADIVLTEIESPEIKTDKVEKLTLEKPAESSSSAKPQNKVKRTTDPAIRKEKKNKTQVAVMMLVLVTIAAMFLIVILMVVGRRYRQLTRRRTIEIEAPDPFWYLKKNRQAKDKQAKEKPTAKTDASVEDEPKSDGEADA